MFCVGLGGIVEAAQHVEEQAFVVAGFEEVGSSLRALRMVASASSYLPWRRWISPIWTRLGVLRIGLGEELELLEGLVELVVAEQGLGQGVEGMRIPGIHVGGALIGGDGVLGLLQLVVNRAQGELHFGGAVGLPERLQ